MRMHKTTDLFFVYCLLAKNIKSAISVILSLFAAAMFLTLIPETSIAQKAQLVPLFSITGADMDKKLNQPSDVFIDEKNEEIYVVDAGNRRVVVFDMDGFYRYQFAMSSSKSGGPRSLVVDNRDEILVVIGGKVACCDFRGSLLEYVDFDGFPYAEKVNATRIKIDKENNYYVLDTAKQRVLVFDSNWNFKFAIDKESLPNAQKKVGKKQAGPIKSSSIVDIWVDDEGMVYLLDSMGSKVLIFNDEGKYLRSIGQPGASFETLSFPNGVAVDNQGRVLVMDTTSHGMLGYDKEGKFLFALGGLGQSEGRFYFPRHVSTDRNGRIYVIEPFLGRIQVLTVKTSS